ncbi:MULTISPECIES: Atxe2 family lasso peptide isopeptidase [unclassified Novosphingobium]|uniref:Atxe2 family lasso peptide isopeptidase n=1 Tax=unclassified Novosphingobium TaxID=2644732 RepID=UPI0014940C68|nr:MULTISPECIES: Atxe2 family lasso peptide isopeptidase [unclassified Novosphingobium]MBB3357027.1 dipeptidyl aminopeptidase/acylaminoacyl peptidase [Novosphingobium sp. BK256]MBB3373428.1 dipeptidyl aminopeptidase/acylaminoacyl peptidase [Novosphingobium sp. BK280]MBB3377797.1 dipeptidyl aminopeptidase/acylaminoacyl peptidase [Novosphingobium sp. BK258]MBB3418792.1 dipeptidyl aminopeptidase/acylaminoacyl peptidase [Novosphingobium sp. BK267]MBB3450373.1 dipeptidyl aminopeptidase/acylaminoacy
MAWMTTVHATAALGITLMTSTVALAADCDTVVPASPTNREPPHAPAAQDLVRLRDIGTYALGFPYADSLAVSPDGKRIAFQIRQASPETNSFCLAMVVLELAPRSSPVVVDRGGTLIRWSFDFRGKAAFPSGMPMPIAPRWSLDGTWIAFLKSVGGITQVWRANADGTDSRPITQSPADVEGFRFSADGHSILFSSRPGLARARQAILQEGLSGYHFDDRWSPMSRSEPFPAAPVQTVANVLDLQTEKVRPATPDERRWLLDQVDATQPPKGIRSRFGRTAWTQVRHDAGPSGRVRVVAEDKSGTAQMCEQCAPYVLRLWWSEDGNSVQFLAREGWALSQTGLYVWHPGQTSPRKIMSSDDLLADCVSAANAVLCLHESSNQPRHILSIPIDGSRPVSLYDPNPEAAFWRKGLVRRLTWTNSFGQECYGDLVLPVGYQPGEHYPLLVVQYETRGYLRGGTGDEYPIQLFANQGYVVLSLQRPRSIGSLTGSLDPVARDKANLSDFADRRSVESSVEMGVAKALESGIVDPERMGITGLSDGATSLQFGLIHSRLFAAAAMSSPPWDDMYALSVGPAAAREFKAMGYPDRADRPNAFWKSFSLASNAGSIKTPLLLQLPDDEYLAGLQGYTALTDAGAPVDMYIFPGEHHIKWQPAHRLAIYNRSLAWFDYWLKGKRNLVVGDSVELDHWATLRAGTASAGSE